MTRRLKDPGATKSREVTKFYVGTHFYDSKDPFVSCDSYTSNDMRQGGGNEMRDEYMRERKGREGKGREGKGREGNEKGRNSLVM